MTIVGKITNIQQTSTAIELTVNDGTGCVDVKYWSDGDDEVRAWYPEEVCGLGKCRLVSLPGCNSV